MNGSELDVYCSDSHIQIKAVAINVFRVSSAS